MFRQFSGNLLNAWGSLTTSARVQLVLTGLATTALVCFVVAWGASPEFVTLYSGLSLEDSALIRGKLVESGVPHRLEDNGRIVQVPRGRAANLRLDLSAEGIPSTPFGVGFEIFDDTDLMTSKFVNDVNYERAVMGTLQQMLNGLDFVKGSQVYITQAEPALFADSQEPSKAAVTLDVGSKPSAKQVEGLLGIITSFGPANLTRDTVTLTLTDGTVLNMPGSDALSGAADEMLEANRSFEREYKMKAEADLAAIGVASVVSVSVERDFSRQSQYVEAFEKGEVVSRETDSTLVSSTESPPQGPAGALSNLPAEDAVIPGDTQTREETESKLENMELPSTVTTTDFAVGRVKSVTASASVGAKRVEQLDDEGNSTGEFTYVKRSKDEVEHYKITIASSIGYGMTKDDVEIAALDYPLDSIAFGGVQGAGAGPDESMLAKFDDTTTRVMQNPFVWWTTRILIALVVFMLVRKVFKGVIQEDLSERQEALDLTTPKDVRQQEIAAEVTKISQEEPEAVAALLRTWLTEDRA